MSNGTGPPTPEQREKLTAARTAERRLRHAVEKSAAATDTRDTAVWAALDAGVTQAELARAMGLSPQRILQIGSKDREGLSE